MKVLHVIPSIATRDGGPTEVVRRLHEALPSIGIESVVVTTDKGISEGDAYLDEAGNVHASKSLPPARLNFSLGVRKVLARELSGADLVHVHAVDAYTSTVAAGMARKAGLPFIVQPHGAYDAYHRDQNATAKNLWFRLFDRKNFDLARAIVVSSEREADGVAGLTRAPVKTIPLGVAPELFCIERGDASESEILFLGRLTEKKHVDIAIRAFARSGLANRGMTLVVAGPLDPRLDYSPKEVASSNGVQDRVRFEGVVDRAKRADLLATCSVFVLPSEDESFGVSAAEAMAAGMCVVASTEVGLAPSAAAAGALVMAAPNEDIFSRELRRLMDDPELRMRTAETGRRYAAENFNWSSVVDDFAGLYRDIAGRAQ